MPRSRCGSKPPYVACVGTIDVPSADAPNRELGSSAGRTEAGYELVAVLLDERFGDPMRASPDQVPSMMNMLVRESACRPPRMRGEHDCH